MLEREAIREIEDFPKNPFSFLPPKALGEIVKADPRKNSSLLLGLAPTHVGMRKDGDKAEFTVLIDRAFGAHELFLFLTTISPNPVFNHKFGVIADWEMPDQAQHISSDKDLKTRHASLGDSWKIFERYRKSFLDILRESESGGLRDVGIIPSFTQAQAERFMELVKTSGFSRKDFKSLNLSDLPEEIKKAIDKVALRLVGRKQVKKFIRGQTNSSSYFSKLTPDRKESFLKKLSESDQGLGMEVNSLLAKSLIDKKYSTVTINGQEVYVSRNLNDTRVVVLSPSRVRFLKGTFSREAVLSLNDGRLVYNIVNTAIKGKILVPVVRWEKNGEKREFVFDAPKEDMGQQDQNVRSLPVMDKIVSGQTFNPLLGFLIVAYFSKELTDPWPKKVSLPGGNNKQFMAQAQVPVLALMHRGSLANTDFIKRIEEYVQRASVVT